MVTSTLHSDSVKIITHGSLSTDCTMEFKNVSVAAVRLFMAASILVFTSGCLRACSGSTSYGNLLNNTVKLICSAVVSLYSVSHCLRVFNLLTITISIWGSLLAHALYTNHVDFACSMI